MGASRELAHCSIVLSVESGEGFVVRSSGKGVKSSLN